jgi:lysophospholipase L1-like esterase
MGRFLALATVPRAALALVGSASGKTATALVLLAVFGFAPTAAVPRANAAEANGIHYYVSLGDSLAAGSQPAIVSDSDQTNEGYADQLYAILRASDPKLRLLKLGCGGESTTSMIVGLSAAPEPTCDPRVYKSRYRNGTQLGEAVSFLHAHRQFVDHVTIDIGVNDVLGGGGVPAIEANLPLILAALRDAVGPGVPIVGMTYYDPFLAQIWFTSFDLVALQAEANSHILNGALENIYGSFGDPVAEVDQAFSNKDTTLQSDGLPLDVQRICEWTWTCVAGDIHPNAIGYGVIAQTFEQSLP